MSKPEKRLPHEACACFCPKALTEMNVQIANVISGLTGMAILDAILSGERDRYQLQHWPIRALDANMAADAYESYDYRQWSHSD